VFKDFNQIGEEFLKPWQFQVMLIDGGILDLTTEGLQKKEKGSAKWPSPSLKYRTKRTSTKPKFCRIYPEVLI
jgi:hypothetical protein